MSNQKETIEKEIMNLKQMKSNNEGKFIITDTNVQYMVTDKENIAFPNTKVAYFNIHNAQIFDTQEQAEYFLTNISNIYKRRDGNLILINVMPLSQAIDKIIQENEFILELINDL